VGKWHPDPIGGVPYYKDITIALQNTGTSDVGGVVLDIKLQGNTTNIHYLDIYAHAPTTSGLLGVLHVQESKDMAIRLTTFSTGEESVLSAYSLVITAMLDKTVLDRQTVEIGA
jgi:hypothetical protein